MKITDLPPKLREQVEAQIAANAATNPRRSKGNRATGVATDGWCFDCRVHFDSTGKWQKHSDATGHRRFELDPSGFYGLREVA